MPLRVLCRAQYVTAPVPNMRGVDFNATHLVKACKGLDVNPNSYSNVQIGGQNVRITSTNKDRAMDWFAEWAAMHVNSMGDGNKVLLAVPSSKTTRGSTPDFRTAHIATRIAALCPNTTVSTALRFKKALPNSREEGGSRDPHVLYPQMVLTAPLPDGSIILVDDVMTGGGHLKASAWIVEDAGRTVEHAVCCGRSTDTRMDDPFNVPEENLGLARNPFTGGF